MGTGDKDYIGFDPVVWVDRLQDVNADSQFTKTERAVIQRHLSALRSDLLPLRRQPETTTPPGRGRDEEDAPGNEEGS